MQGSKEKYRWMQVRGAKRAHWGILTLDDLPRTNVRYADLIAQLQARDQASKEIRGGKSNQKSEDFGSTVVDGKLR
jgi:hypothetical protein